MTTNETRIVEATRMRPAALAKLSFGPVPSGKTLFQIGFLALLWAGLSWWVQDIASAPGLWKQNMMLLKDQGLRFLLNWSAAAALLSLLKTRYVALLLAVSAFADGAILSFFSIFRRSLSWLTISNQSGEGAAVALVALELATPYLLVICAASAVVTFLHRRWSENWEHPTFPVGVAATTWMAVFLGLHLDHKPLDRLATFETADGIAHSYGFLITWMAEGFYIDNSDLSAAAIEQLEKPAERLVSVVPPTRLGTRIALVQVESLDDALVDFKLNEVPVIPFLNQYKAAGTYLRIQAPKRNGSCDSDFSILFGGWPSQQAVPYRIPNFPFERSVIAGLSERGIPTALYHGVNGTFFERRAAFETMGFSALTFREELISALGIRDPQWTLPDSVVFDAATAMRSDRERFFELIITGTSHTPFQFSLAGHPERFFPNSSDKDERYFDTMNYVDTSIAKYVVGLPQDTVVLIYGDHWSSVVNKKVGYESQMIDEFGVVPMILFRTTASGIVPLMDVDDELGSSAQLRLVDVARWLRRSLELDHPGRAPSENRFVRPNPPSTFRPAASPRVHSSHHEKTL